MLCGQQISEARLVSNVKLCPNAGKLQLEFALIVAEAVKDRFSVLQERSGRSRISGCQLGGLLVMYRGRVEAGLLLLRALPLYLSIGGLEASSVQLFLGVLECRF